MNSLSEGRLFLTVVLIVLIGASAAVTFYMESPESLRSSNNLTGETAKRADIHPLFAHKDTFYVIAHRGAKAYYPENTMPAFKGALQMGANMIELDVRLSRDGIPVVIHDRKVNRTTDGKGMVASFSADQLKQLDAGSWFSRRFSGVSIPTLEEALQWARDTVAINIELKPLADRAARHGGLEEKSVNLVKKYGMEDQVLFSSFNYESIHHIQTMNPEMATALLYNWRTSDTLLPSELVARYQVDAFNCSKDELNRRWISNLKMNDLPVLIYTVNRRRTMRKLYKQGVNGIFTNKPDLLTKVIAETMRPPK